MLGIVPYIIAAAVKFRHFLICERKLHNLLRAACADNSRNADKYIVFAIFSAKLCTASGIPPTNLDIVTKTGTERRPVETCYPLMIRVKDKNMTVKAQWDIF